MFKLAFRGVFRYKKRSFITMFAIAIAVVFTIFMQTIITGLQLDSNKNLVYNDTSSAKIYAKGYFSERDYLPIDKLITKEQGSSLQKLLLDNNYTDVTKEFISSAQIMFYEDPFPTSGSLTAIIKAIDSTNSQAYKYDDANIKGKWLTKGVDGVVIGAKLADDIKADVGYFLTIQTKGKGGFIQAFDIPIIGIISTGDPVIDASTLFFDINTIDYYLELDGSATSYAVSYTKNIAKLKKITDQETINLKEIANQVDLEAYSWKEIADDILHLQASKGGFANIFLFFTFVIAIVGISNTMLMAISERKNEIAMLKTLGYSDSYIKKSFTIEGGIIGLIGILIGSILGIVISIYYQFKGIDFSYYLKYTDSIGYRINSIVYTYVLPSQMIIIAICGLLVSMLAAYFAVKKTAKGEINQLFKKL